MQRATFLLAAAAFVLSLWCWMRPSSPVVASSRPEIAAAERLYPPLIFSSKAWLTCSVSSTQSGRLALHTVDGQGFAFDTRLLPVKTNKVLLQEPGLVDEFDAFPATTFSTCFRGLGEGTITAMKLEVWMQVRRYVHSVSGDIRFDVTDAGSDPAYVEFTSIFIRRNDSKRFPFRMLFGHLPHGIVSIAPDAFHSSQTLRLGSSQKPASVMTALYEEEDDVPLLPSQ